MSTFDVIPATGSPNYTFTFDLPGSFSAVIVQVTSSGSGIYVTQLVGVNYDLDRDAQTVTFLAGSIPVSGTDTVRIFRFTTRTRKVDYKSGSTITEANLDNDANRLNAILQEIEDGITSTGGPGASTTGQYLGRTADDQNWDARDDQIKNVDWAVDDQDAVNLSQARALLAGQSVLEIDNGVTLQFTGDGVTDLFELVGIGGLASEEQAFVYVAGVRMSSFSDQVYSLILPDDTDFPSGGTVWAYLEFVDPPVNGSIVEVVTVSGTVVATVAAISISTGDIQDDAVTPAKVSHGTGRQFLKMDGAPSPSPEWGDATAQDLTGAYAAASRSAGFASAVNESKIHELATPTAALPMNNKKITGLAAGGSSGEAVELSQMTAGDSSTLTSARDYTDATLAAQTFLRAEEKTVALDGNDTAFNVGFTIAPKFFYISVLSTNGFTYHGFAKAPASGSVDIFLAGSGIDGSSNEISCIISFDSTTQFDFNFQGVPTVSGGLAQILSMSF